MSETGIDAPLHILNLEQVLSTRDIQAVRGYLTSTVYAHQ